MKKYIKPHMVRVMIEQFFTRILIALLIAVAYNIFIFGEFKLNATFFNYPLLTVGFICLALGWFSYLKFDGLKVNLAIDQHNREKKHQKKSKHKLKNMMDYSDEKIREDQELLPDEKTVCSMIANLTSGAILIIPSVILLLTELL